MVWRTLSSVEILLHSVRYSGANPAGLMRGKCADRRRALEHIREIGCGSSPSSGRARR